MKVMILAAGHGKRMRPVTLDRPKPLVEVAGKPLIQHHIERLRDVGFREFVINISYKADMIRSALGNGDSLGVSIAYSEEVKALETAGGLLHAAPLLGERPFLLVNSDIWLDYPLAQLTDFDLRDDLGHLVLVNNPAHHPEGDFALAPTGAMPSDARVPARLLGCDSSLACFTFAGLSVLTLGLIQSYQRATGDSRAKFRLKPVFDWAIAEGRLSGEHYDGFWLDVGTPERLAELNTRHASPVAS